MGLDAKAIQSAHSGVVYRVGGLAIYITLIVSVSILLLSDFDAFELSVLVFSALPVFLIGMAEDIGFPMHPYRRLAASVISGFLILIILDMWISAVAIPGIDTLLRFAPIGIAFTIFSTTGVVNAFNLIDGLNGLSSYVSISTAVSLYIVAESIGYYQISTLMVLISVIVMGFLLLNFPNGKIFLGDAGAYILGHILVWSSIILVNFESNLSPFSILLIFFWPIADTILAIWRRWRLGNPTDRPDRLHFHQLAMRLIEIRFIGRGKRKISNPVTTIILIPFITIPQILGVIFINDLSVTIWCTLGMIILFVTTYLGGIYLARKKLRRN